MDAPMIESEASQLGRAANATQAAAGSAGILNGGKFHLGQANIPIDRNTTYAELEAQEATYAGYAAIAAVWSAPTTAADLTVESLSTTVVFIPTGATVENSIYNCWLSDVDGEAWYFAGPLPGGPYPMASALDKILLTFRFRPAVQSLAVFIT